MVRIFSICIGCFVGCGGLGCLCGVDGRVFMSGGFSFFWV